MDNAKITFLGINNLPPINKEREESQQSSILKNTSKKIWNVALPEGSSVILGSSLQ